MSHIRCVCITNVWTRRNSRHARNANETAKNCTSSDKDELHDYWIKHPISIHSQTYSINKLPLANRFHRRLALVANRINCFTVEKQGSKPSTVGQYLSLHTLPEVWIRQKKNWTILIERPGKFSQLITPCTIKAMLIGSVCYENMVVEVYIGSNW